MSRKKGPLVVEAGAMDAAGLCRTHNTDVELFRQAMRDVRPHRSAERAERTPPRVEARARSLEADDAQVMRELLLDPDPDILEHGETLHYRAPGVQDSVLRRLRRGHYRLQRDLDLHGLNRHQARDAVVRFLVECQRQDLHCVRIVHGKGNGSPNSGPILKHLLDSWLRRRADVVAYCSARPADGGSGAVYVLLRS